MVSPLEELIFFNKLSEETVIFGKKIKWHTLDGEEFQSALQSTPAFDDFTRMQMLKIEKLTRAIDSIDGHTWLELITKEDKDTTTPLAKAREIIRKWQKNVIDYFYYKYEQFEQKGNKALEDLEKSFQNSPRPSASNGA
jgi:hypothetical protein